MKFLKDAAVLITTSNSYFVWSATCWFSLVWHVLITHAGVSLVRRSPLTPMFHPFCQWADHVFSIRSTWQRWNTAVILAPSCNLDVYINYFYNQLTHTHYWKCVGMCARARVLCFSKCVFLCLLFFLVCKVGAIYRRFGAYVNRYTAHRACAQCSHVRVPIWNQYEGQMIIWLQRDLYMQHHPAANTHTHRHTHTFYWLCHSCSLLCN